VHDINPFLRAPFVDDQLSDFVLTFVMPEAYREAGDRIKEKLMEKGELHDYQKVIDECGLIVSKRAKATTITPAALAAFELEFDVEAGFAHEPEPEDTPLAAAGGGGGGGGGGRKQREQKTVDPKAGIMCPFCPHADKDGNKKNCLSDPTHVPAADNFLMRRIASNPKTLARVKEQREANAKILGVHAKPLPTNVQPIKQRGGGRRGTPGAVGIPEGDGDIFVELVSATAPFGGCNRCNCGNCEGDVEETSVPTGATDSSPHLVSLLSPDYSESTADQEAESIIDSHEATIHLKGLLGIGPIDNRDLEAHLAEGKQIGLVEIKTPGMPTDVLMTTSRFRAPALPPRLPRYAVKPDPELQEMMAGIWERSRIDALSLQYPRFWVRSAVLTLQSHVRMRAQRRQYQKDLAEMKEETRPSTEISPEEWASLGDWTIRQKDGTECSFASRFPECNFSLPVQTCRRADVQTSCELQAANCGPPKLEPSKVEAETTVEPEPIEVKMAAESSKVEVTVEPKPVEFKMTAAERDKYVGKCINSILWMRERQDKRVRILMLRWKQRTCSGFQLHLLHKRRLAAFRAAWHARKRAEAKAEGAGEDKAVVESATSKRTRRRVLRAVVCEHLDNRLEWEEIMTPRELATTFEAVFHARRARHRALRRW
jgi:hypothetical protein